MMRSLTVVMIRVIMVFSPSLRFDHVFFASYLVAPLHALFVGIHTPSLAVGLSATPSR